MKNITPKAFARMFAVVRDGCEAAIRLGVPVRSAKTEGARLVTDRRVRRELRRLDSEEDSAVSAVKAGLSRLAFGQVNDVAALVFAQEPTSQQLAHADLFNVSEIKRVKGGGVEVKFFDRQRALEKLLELDEETAGAAKAQEFLDAVAEGAGSWASKG